MKKIFLFILLSNVAFSQIKRPLTHQDYDSWNTISETQISNNGQWAVYIFTPQEGDSRLIFYPLLGNAIDTIPRASNMFLSEDSQWAVFKINPSFSEVRQAKLKKKKKEDFPLDSLGIKSLVSGETIKFANVKSFDFPEKSTDWMAFLTQSKSQIDSVSKKKKSKKENDENGYELNICSLKSNTIHKFPYVYKYKFDKSGQNLIFASSGKDSTFKPGLYRFSVINQSFALLNESKDIFKHFSIDDNSEKFCAISDPDTTRKALKKNIKFWFWKKDEIPMVVVDSVLKVSEYFPYVSEDYTPVFSKDGSKLFFGLSAPSLVKDTTRIDDEIVHLDLWNWQDKRNMPQQLANLKNDLKASFLTVFDTKKMRFWPLADQDFSQINLTQDKNENLYLAVAPYAYTDQHWLFNPPVNVALVYPEKDQKIKIIDNKRISNLQMSPDAMYVVYYSLQDTAWFVVNTKNQKTSRMTFDKSFSEFEDDDHPDDPPSYGLAGFTNKGKVWVYDKFDIWSFDLSRPSDFRRLTNGKENNLTYRYIKLIEKETEINEDSLALLHSFNNRNKRSGYAYLNPKTLENKELISDEMYFSQKVWKSKNTSDLVFTVETFEVFPDLQHTKLPDFKQVNKISTANPQQNGINWGNVELVEYVSSTGKKLNGMLYRPENFNPEKKYPMITYFYEKLSDELYRYVVPQPARSSINYSYYVSNGYFVFVPDIVYRTGYPGESAMECIVPGVKKIMQRPYIDSTRLGIQGHSWGGYQTAYMITKTNLFRAAEAGAPVANMTSAYGGIRWESGFSRQGQYERTQTRLGATLWQSPKLYLENSPLFYLPNVYTPLLMMHNDDDGAVPWYQGIEMFMGLKRLQKPVWLINYNGEKHGLTQRKNRKDWSQRMAQFFDYYLKDSPIPIWMKDGIKATEKTLNYGLGINKQ